MGHQTLREFRSDVNHSIGNLGVSNDWLDRRINDAYQTVMGRAEFFGALHREVILSVENQVSYDLPATVVGIEAVVDLSNRTRLTRVLLKDFRRLLSDASVASAPRKWARDGTCMFLWPPPDEDDLEIAVDMYVSPDPLTDGSDTTVLPAPWDVVVGLFARSYAMLFYLDDEGMKQRYEYSILTAERMLTTLLKDRERDAQSPGGGLGVARTVGDVEDMEV